MSFWPLKDPITTLPIAGQSLSQWLAQDLFTEGELSTLRYPWQLLDLHGPLLEKLNLTPSHTPAQLADGATLIIGEGTKILPGVYIEGVVVIGKDCKIGPNAHLRGPISIGDNCHVGQAVELKNVIFGNNVHVGHLSYIGDSILADKVNFGAATITSNLRHDGKNHRSEVAGEVIDTARRKFGTIAGEGVHTGIHTALYPGRKLGPSTCTLPGEVVTHDKT